MKRRTYLKEQRHARKPTTTKGKGNSKYARKKAWLRSHRVEQGDRLVELWGFQVPSPKPW